MKSKRIYLVDSNKSEKITDMMKKLRGKYVNCKDVKISLDEPIEQTNQDENLNPNEVRNLPKNYQTPPKVPKSVDEIKSCQIKSEKMKVISKFSEETNEETEEKDYPYKRSDFLLKNKKEEKDLNKIYLEEDLPKENCFLSKLNKEHENEKSFIQKDSGINFSDKLNLNSVDFLMTEEKFPALKADKANNYGPIYEWIDNNLCSVENEGSQSNFSGVYLDDYSEDKISNSEINDDVSDSEVSSNDESILIRSPSLAKTHKREFKDLFQGKITFQNIKFNKNLKSPLNVWKSFGLVQNDDIPTSPSNHTHNLLPLKYKNDEKYKSRLFKFLRKPQIPHNKTETCKFVKFRKYSERFDGNISKYYDSLGMKMRKVSSEKKVYEAYHLFEDNRAYFDDKGRHPPQYFKFYSDKDVGFTAKWQIQLKSAEMDDDVETDEDQLYAADRHIIREVGEGIRSFIKNRKNVRNYAMIN